MLVRFSTCSGLRLKDLILAPFQCTRHRLYSTTTPSTSLHKWHITSIPAPRSILDDDDTPVDLSEDSDIVNGTKTQTPIHARKPPSRSTPDKYKLHRQAMKEKFPDGWHPPRKLSREAMDGLRDLHRFNPEIFTTPLLADKFKISSEAVRRILKSKWQPPKDKVAKRVAKERALREQAIKLRRMEEIAQAEELQQLKKKRRSSRGQGVHEDSNVRGVDPSDRLTLV